MSRPTWSLYVSPERKIKLGIPGRESPAMLLLRAKLGIPKGSKSSNDKAPEPMAEVLDYKTETKRLWRLCLDNKINPLFNSKTGHYDFDTQERRTLMREVLDEIFAETPKDDQT